MLAQDVMGAQTDDANAGLLLLKAVQPLFDRHFVFGVIKAGSGVQRLVFGDKRRNVPGKPVNHSAGYKNQRFYPGTGGKLGHVLRASHIDLADKIAIEPALAQQAVVVDKAKMEHGIDVIKVLRQIAVANIGD